MSDYRRLIPDGSTWGKSDPERLARLAKETRHSRIMRDEPPALFVSPLPAGASEFEQACRVFTSLAKRDIDVSDIVPDEFD